MDTQGIVEMTAKRMALVAAMTVGQPCPICGSPVKSIDNVNGWFKCSVEHKLSPKIADSLDIDR